MPQVSQQKDVINILSKQTKLLENIDKNYKVVRSDLDNHIARTDALEKYVKNTDNFSHSKKIEYFLWIVSFAVGIMTFLMGLNFDMFKDIWKALNMD